MRVGRALALLLLAGSAAGLQSGGAAALQSAGTCSKGAPLLRSGSRHSSALLAAARKPAGPSAAAENPARPLQLTAFVFVLGLSLVSLTPAKEVTTRMGTEAGMRLLTLLTTGSAAAEIVAAALPAAASNVSSRGTYDHVMLASFAAEPRNSKWKRRACAWATRSHTESHGTSAIMSRWCSGPGSTISMVSTVTSRTTGARWCHAAVHASANRSTCDTRNRTFAVRVSREHSASMIANAVDLIMHGAERNSNCRGRSRPTISQGVVLAVRPHWTVIVCTSVCSSSASARMSRNSPPCSSTCSMKRAGPNTARVN